MNFNFLRNKPNSLDIKINELTDQINKANLTINETLSLRKLFSSGISGGYDGADELHNIYEDYGYPDSLSFDNFWNMYRRFGIASAVIEKPVDFCFLTNPIIKASERTLSELDSLIKDLKLWDRVKGVDRRQRVGRYAGLFMQVRDGKAPSEPIEGVLSGVNSLVRIIPIYEGQLSVGETDQDINSENFGNPLNYQYNSNGVGNKNEESNSSQTIDASRIIIFSEGADDGSIYGIPALEASYNSLLDCRKILGGSAEGYYRNTAQSLILKTSQGARSFNSQKELDDFNRELEEFTRKRMRKHLYAPNMDVQAINSSASSPKDPFTVSLNDVSAACGIPSTILVGNQTGRLASTEDGKTFLRAMQSRRENYLSDSIENLIKWLMDYSIIAKSEFEVTWDDLLSSSDEEKLNNADKMASVNHKQYSSGQPPVFAVEEIREASGYMEDDLSDDLLDDEGIDDEGIEDDQEI